MNKPGHLKRLPSLESAIKRELTQRGYVEVDPVVPDGGIWTHPDWNTAADVYATIADCFRREREQ